MKTGRTRCMRSVFCVSKECSSAADNTRTVGDNGRDAEEEEVGSVVRKGILILFMKSAAVSSTASTGTAEVLSVANGTVDLTGLRAWIYTGPEKAGSRPGIEERWRRHCHTPRTDSASIYADAANIGVGGGIVGGGEAGEDTGSRYEGIVDGTGVGVAMWRFFFSRSLRAVSAMRSRSMAAAKRRSA